MGLREWRPWIEASRGALLPDTGSSPLLTHAKHLGASFVGGDSVGEPDSWASRPAHKISCVCLQIQAMPASGSTSAHLSFVGLLYREGDLIGKISMKRAQRNGHHSGIIKTTCSIEDWGLSIFQIKATFEAYFNWGLQKNNSYNGHHSSIIKTTYSIEDWGLSIFKIKTTFEAYFNWGVQKYNSYKFTKHYSKAVDLLLLILPKFLKYLHLKIALYFKKGGRCCTNFVGCSWNVCDFRGSKQHYIFKKRYMLHKFYWLFFYIPNGNIF